MYLDDLNLHLFVEYKKIDAIELPKHILLKLISDKVVINDNNAKIHFNVTGFISVDEIFVVIMPKTYNLNVPKEVLLNDIKLLFNVLLKYNSSKTKLNHEKRKGNELTEGTNSKISSAYYLIEAYLESGIYRKQNVVETVNKHGKKKWNKTVQKNNPIISGDTVLYDKIIYSSKNDDLENIIVRYHKIALRKSIERYGWILNIKIEDYDDLITDIEYDVQKAKAVLIRELRELNSEKSIEVIKNIYDILVGYNTDSNFSDFQVLYNKSFYYVWEAICGSVFTNQYNQLKTMIPKPVWNFNNPNRNKNMSQIPDILVINENHLFVLDAKFYDLDVTAPGWPDVVKQFFYSHTIKENLPNAYNLISNEKLRNLVMKIDTFSNVFAFPTFENVEIKKVGNVLVHGSLSLGVIDAYEINVRDVMALYLEDKKISFLSLIQKTET